MALQMLHGPITMTVDPDDSTLGGVATFDAVDECVWMDAHGWVGEGDPSVMTGIGGSGAITCNLDGVTRLRCYMPSSVGNIYTICEDGISNRCHVTYSGGSIITWEPLVGRINVSEGYVNAMTYAHLRTRYGWIRYQGGVQIAPLDATGDGDFVTVHTLSPAPSVGTQDYWTLGPDNLAYFWPGGGTTNEIIIFDLLEQVEVFPDGVTTNRWTLDHYVGRLTYSRKFDCFMTFEFSAGGGTAGLLHVYSKELVPDSMTDPAADPAIYAGGVSEISVTLTDDNGVGIPDRVIVWSLTAGTGTIVDTTSTTNEAGVASTYYRAQITGGVDPTIEASLTY